MNADGPIDRDHFDRFHPVCMGCVRFQTFNDDGDAGCVLLRVLHDVCPGRIGQHLLHGGGCLDDPPQFDAVTTEPSL